MVEPTRRRWMVPSMSATIGGAVIRHLYGVDEPSPDLPDDKIVG
jgi:hypothetical protein